MLRSLLALSGLVLLVGSLFAQDSPAPEQRLAAGETVAAPSGGELYYQLQLLQREVMQLRGQLEEHGHELRQLSRQSRDRYTDIDRRLGNLAVGGNAADSAAVPRPPRDSLPQQQGLPRAAVPAPGESEAYRQAYNLVSSQQFPAAMSAFWQFLQDYPNSQFVANAHYWMGELYLVSEPPDEEAARRAFTLLLKQYPDNGKVPDALYKLGMMYFERGDLAKAREYFDRVLNEHGSGNSAAVKLTRDILDRGYQESVP